MTRLSLEQMMNQSRHDRASAELLDQLLSGDTNETPYAQPQNWTEETWDELESALPLAGWSATEVQQGSDRFFAAVASCWSKTSQTEVSQSEAAESAVLQSLQAQFGQVLPGDWLQTISDRAQTLAQATVSPLEQLVDCVQPLLTDWTVDDLQVFARPVAFAMRSQAAPVPNPESWSALSPVEQARYTLKVAQYALQVVQKTDPQ